MNLDVLHPRVRSMAQQLLSAAAKAGIAVQIVQTGRTLGEQAELYAQGRTEPGEIVTNAKPGSSFHNFGLAIDVVPVVLIHKPNWDPTSPLWAKLGAIGKAIGFRWGGDFHSIVDRPHFEWSGEPSLTLADLRAGKRP